MKKGRAFIGCLVCIMFIGLGTASADDFGIIDDWSAYGHDGGIADLSFAGGDLTLPGVPAEKVDSIVQITTNPSSDFVQCWGAYPWSSDGEWIVYTSNREGGNEICRVKYDGSGFTQLTVNNACDSHASFTPDDSRILFQSDRTDGDAEIWIMDADGSNQINLTHAHGGAVTDGCENKPRVSPDGTKIAFHTCYEDIWVMDIDGTDPVRVSLLGGLDIPEGSNIVFSPNGSGGYTVTALSGGNFQWEADYGDALGLEDDDTYGTTFGTFSFPFAGTTYTGEDPLYVSSNGFVSLGGDNGNGCCDGNPSDLVDEGTYARIAPVWTDLDPGDTGDAYLNTFSDVKVPESVNRMVITWDTEFYENDGLVTVQVQLLDDGTIIMGYLSYDDNREDDDLLIGVSPGDGVSDPGITDLTSSVPFSSGAEPTIYEVFLAGMISDSTKHSWSPDSQWVLFNGWESDGDGCRIFKAKADGTAVTKLSDENSTITFADESTFTADWKCENWAFWSPDGEWIAYHVRYGTEQSDYYSTLSIMKPDGSQKQHLVVQGYNDTDGDDWDWVCGPKSWGPDSEWIAFKMNGLEEISIFMVNIYTREIIQLTEDFYDYRHWWSPDGDKILFRDYGYQSRDEGDYNYDLVVINLKTKVVIPGDMNGDGVIDKNDLYALLGCLNQPAIDSCSAGDMDGDGEITIVDVRQLITENPILARDRRLRRLLR